MVNESAEKADQISITEVCVHVCEREGWGRCVDGVPQRLKTVRNQKLNLKNMSVQTDKSLLSFQYDETGEIK